MHGQQNLRRYIGFISLRKLHQNFYFPVVIIQRVTKETVINFASLLLNCLLYVKLLNCIINYLNTYSLTYLTY